MNKTCTRDYKAIPKATTCLTTLIWVCQWWMEWETLTINFRTVIWTPTQWCRWEFLSTVTQFQWFSLQHLQLCTSRAKKSKHRLWNPLVCWAVELVLNLFLKWISKFIGLKGRKLWWSFGGSLKLLL